MPADNSYMQVTVAQQLTREGLTTSSYKLAFGVIRPHMWDVTSVNLAFCLDVRNGTWAAQGSARS